MIRSNLSVGQKIARPKKEPTQVYVYYTRSRVRKMEEQAVEIQHLRQAQEEMRHSQKEMRQEQGVIKEQLAAIMGMLQRLFGEKAPAENTQTQEQKIAVKSEKDTIVGASGIETENVSTEQTTLPTPLFNPYMYPQVSDGQYTFPVASATASGTFVPRPHPEFGTSYVPPPPDYSHLYTPGVATAKPV
ncbi:Mdv1p, partial [Corchorus olitorius]